MLHPGPPGPRLSLEETGLQLWFREKAGVGLASALSVQIEAVITRFRSQFQEIAVLQTRGFGRMLVLDGVIMLTEFDESSYHEMIAHVPLLCHPGPRRVLVVGGGDGGAVREALRHPGVERVVLCELDRAVVETCREHFPGLAARLDDPRVEVVYEDGAEYAAEAREAFEVIITDSTDPVGPAEVLFRPSYYQALFRALSPQGIAVSQAESFFYHPQVIGPLLESIGRIFPLSAYYHTAVPTYPSGLIGFAYASKGPHPLADLDLKRAELLEGLSYYTPAVHRAAFVLPRRGLEVLPAKTRQFQESLSA